MLKAPGMLMIGATGRKLGKTELAAGVLARHRGAGLVGIKVTPIDPHRPCPSGGDGCGVCSSLEGPFAISEETQTSGDKDTNRLLAAGAQRVVWLRALRSQLPVAAAALLETLGPGCISVCESSSLRPVIEPDLFLLVTGPEPWKESARAARPMADGLVRRGAGGLESVRDRLCLEGGRWSLPVEAAAIVMAGGQSARMGQDKALLQVAGRPLISAVVEQLSAWLPEILISSNDPDRLAFTGLQVVVDREPGQGPLMGIASALSASPCERNLVVACDMPRVDRALARELLARLNAADVAVPVDTQGRFEPLFAAYRKGAAETLFKTLAAGKRRIWDAFPGLRVERIELSDSDRLVNLNTPADLNAFLGGNDEDADRSG